jgi:hypothetical protein
MTADQSNRPISEAAAAVQAAAEEARNMLITIQRSRLWQLLFLPAPPKQ